MKWFDWIWRREGRRDQHYGNASSDAGSQRGPLPADDSGNDSVGLQVLYNPVDKGFEANVE
jgi:hypothetical protein